MKISDKEQLIAICLLNGNNKDVLNGEVVFSQRMGPVDQDKLHQSTLISASFNNLKTGLHGFHIHEFGDLSKGCDSAGPHFNPFKKKHGGPGNTERHVGDMGNVESKNDIGPTLFKMSDELIRLDNGEGGVVGRSVV